jgi:hypothetical protein
MNSCIAPILIHEFPDLAFLPLLANEWHPAIGREAVRQEADAPAEQRPERPIRFRCRREIDDVQKEINRYEDCGVQVERSDFTDTTACTLVPTPIVG